jgi:hypothetical protein
VEDARRVRVLESFEQAAREGERLGNRERPAAEALAKRLSLDVLHGEEGHARRLPGLVEGGDGRMLKACRGLGLAEDPGPQGRR